VQRIQENKSGSKQGVQWSHFGLAIFTLKNIILRHKKNYENSNISPCKKIYSSKNPLKETKILQDIIRTLLELISSFNTSPNIIFQKSSYKN
jgi:hypothetical protein